MPGSDYRCVPSREPETHLWLDTARRSRALEEVVGLLDNQVRRPRTVTVVMAQCKRLDTFYVPHVPSKHRIVICAELAQYFNTLFSKAYEG